MLVASTQFARAQGSPAAPVGGLQPPVVEPLPTTALPAAPPPAQALPVLWPPQPQTIHEKRLWLAVPGALVFGLSYGVAFIVGGMFALTPSPTANSVSNDLACDSTCKKQGALLMIPVAGPLLSFELWPHSATDTEVALVWSGLEAVGLTMLVVGMIGHDVPLEPLPTVAGTTVSIVPSVTPEGGMLSLRTPW
jgi:hypothetical protein